MADPDLPAHDELADDADEQDWDRSQLGPMAEAVTAHEDDEIPDVAPYDPARDKYLNPNRGW